MAVREDLVSSAINFLQDPSVANAPLEKRIAFLQSKNLTQEEIDVSLSRAGEAGAVARPQATQGAYGYQSPMRQQPAGYSQGSYQGDYWQQPPPEVPRRDWRDYFIMATVMSGLSYGLYFCAKRYIAPLIAPPTPPQLEQDKSAIDESFGRAFALIDQLAADTATIKASEEARKERMDSALAEVELATKEMKTSSRRRDEDSRRIGDEVRALQALIPKALKAQEESNDARLRELTTELKSLKTLVANRVSREPTSKPAAAAVNGTNMFGPQGTASTNGGSLPLAETTASSGGAVTNTSDASPSPMSDRANTASPYSPYTRLTGNRAGIPAWQMAAAKKAELPTPTTSDSGTVTEVDGISNGAGAY